MAGRHHESVPDTKETTGRRSRRQERELEAKARKKAEIQAKAERTNRTHPPESKARVSVYKRNEKTVEGTEAGERQWQEDNDSDSGLPDPVSGEDDGYELAKSKDVEWDNSAGEDSPSDDDPEETRPGYYDRKDTDDKRGDADEDRGSGYGSDGAMDDKPEFMAQETEEQGAYGTSDAGTAGGPYGEGEEGDESDHIVSGLRAAATGAKIAGSGSETTLKALKAAERTGLSAGAIPGTFPGAIPGAGAGAGAGAPPSGQAPGRRDRRQQAKEETKNGLGLAAGEQMTSRAGAGARTRRERSPPPPPEEKRSAGPAVTVKVTPLVEEPVKKADKPAESKGSKPVESKHGKTDKSDKPAESKHDKSSKSNKHDKSDKHGKSDKPSKSDRHDKTDKPSKSDKHGKPTEGKGDKSSKPAESKGDTKRATKGTEPTDRTEPASADESTPLGPGFGRHRQKAEQAAKKEAEKNARKSEHKGETKGETKSTKKEERKRRHADTPAFRKLDKEREEMVMKEYSFTKAALEKKFGQKESDKIMENINAQKLFQDEKFYDCFHAYGKPGLPLLDMKSTIHKDESVSLVYAKQQHGIDGSPSQNVIIKHYFKEGSRRDTTYEIEVYYLLRDLLGKAARSDPSIKDGDKAARQLIARVLPWFSSVYQVSGEPVMVLERLDPLDYTDSWTKVGAEIIHHLRYIHKRGVHCDIKPDNIMKKIRTLSDGSKRMFYYLIDFGGLTMRKRREGGWVRWLWSPKWTIADRDKASGRVCYGRTDFLELAPTMRCLEIWAKAGTNIRTHRKDVHGGFEGRLKKYVDYCAKLPEVMSYEDSVYQDLINILTK